MTLIFLADFEEGNLSEWTDTSQGNHNRAVTAATVSNITGKPTAARKGSWFYESLVKNGENILGGERCEILRSPIDGSLGNDRWYGWSWALPTGYPSPVVAGSTKSVLLGQFHSDSGEAAQGQANIQITLAPNLAGANYSYSGANPGLVLGINGGSPLDSGQYANINDFAGAGGRHRTSYTFDLGALSLYKGVGWIDFAWHVIWSDTGTGTVELYRRFAGETNYTRIAQMLNCSNVYYNTSNGGAHGVYNKLGQNRTQSSGIADGYAWFDEYAWGTTQADVDPGGGGGGGDVTPPVLLNASINGTALAGIYNEDLLDSSVPAPSDFTVKVNGTPVTIAAVRLADTTESAPAVVLALAAAVDRTDVVTWTYTGTSIKDVAGNSAATFADQAVVNATRRKFRVGGRTAGTRVSNPSGRIPNVGGGGI